MFLVEGFRIQRFKVQSLLQCISAFEAPDPVSEACKLPA